MLAFVIPIKPKHASKDWDYDNRLFERTARSICSQDNKDFKLIAIYNDKPEINFHHENIIYVKYPFSYVKSEEIEDYESKIKRSYSKDYAEKMMDKSKKIMYGCKLAKDINCNYIMAVDSDDLVSKKLAGEVNSSNRRNAGYRIKKGYIYKEGAKFVEVNDQIHNINGSTHIIREDLISIPDFKTNIFHDYSLFESHGYTFGRIRDLAKEYLIDLPFAGVVYVAHKNNYSRISELMNTKSIKNFIKFLLRGRIITKELKDEFQLYSVHQ